MSLSAVILTKNEEKNIERCLRSLSWCDEIVIIDDYSEDSTIGLISQIGKKAKIYQRHLNADFAAQRNFGLEKVYGDWVLFVDADEEISTELQQEIQKTLQNYTVVENCKGFLFKRRDYFGGKWLKYGETANIRLLRLARRGSGKWEGRVHEVWKVEGEIGELKNPILHYPHPTASEFLRKINRYTDIVAQCWKEKGRRMGFWEIIAYPMGKFLNNYILKLGFLDGAPGLLMAIFMSFHSFLVRSKYWMMLVIK